MDGLLKEVKNKWIRKHWLVKIELNDERVKVKQQNIGFIRSPSRRIKLKMDKEAL